MNFFYFNFFNRFTVVPFLVRTIIQFCCFADIRINIIVLDKILAPAFCKRVYSSICRVIAERICFSSLESVQQLEGVTENGRRITAVDFFDNQVELFVGIEISPLDNLRKRPGCKFIANTIICDWQNLPDELGVGVFRVEHDTNLVLLRNVLQLLPDFIALAASRNTVIDDLGRIFKWRTFFSLIRFINSTLRYICNF